MDAHYADRLTLNLVSKASCLSVAYLKKFFTDYFHITPYQYLQKVRLEKAELLLAGEEVSLSDVATSVGYSNHSAFSRAFRKHFNCTPFQFKKSSLSAQSQ